MYDFHHQGTEPENIWDADSRTQLWEPYFCWNCNHLGTYRHWLNGISSNPNSCQDVRAFVMPDTWQSSATASKEIIAIQAVFWNLLVYIWMFVEWRKLFHWKLKGFIARDRLFFLSIHHSLPKLHQLIFACRRILSYSWPFCSSPPNSVIFSHWGLLKKE